MSSTKKVIEPFHFLTNQSLGTSFVTSAVDVRYMDRVCFEVIWTTSDGVGSIIPQATSDNVNWVNLDMLPITMASANDFGIFDIEVTSTPKIRLSYTRTSGTGTLNGYVSAKES